MPRLNRAIRKWLVSAASILCATGFVMSAQTPAPTGAGAPAAQPQAGAPPAAGQAPAAEAAAGRGRGRGGPEQLQGGPQLSDPAYANYEFPKRPSLLPLTPDKQL